MQHRISAGAIVEDAAGRLLLVRHVLPARYDFWVAPGGGVQGSEELAAAAIREVREESGLHVAIDRLAYIEEFANPETRHVKFWFTARVSGGEMSSAAPEAKAEHIVEAAWLSRSDLAARTVFPSVLTARYWDDRNRGFAAPIHLALRMMEFW
jgi:8-oxo-dGTP diphosphatase